MSARPRRPLLIVDGDSFAHRAYHGLPKTIRRAGNKGGGAIVGFANYLLRFYEAEQPRAVVVGWDTLDTPNWREREFPPYQGGREFDDELVDQLDVLPEFVRAFGFVAGKAAGFEADDFLAAAVAVEERRGGSALVASGDRDAFQLASDRTTILHPVKAGELARIGPSEVRERYGVGPGQVPISSRCAATRRTSSPAPAASARKAPRPCCTNTPVSKTPSPTACSPGRPRSCGSTGGSRRWTRRRRSRRSTTRPRPGARPPPWRATGTSGGWRRDWRSWRRRLNPLPHRGRGGTHRASDGWVRVPGRRFATGPPSPQPSPACGGGG